VSGVVLFKANENKGEKSLTLRIEYFILIDADDAASGK
jgi:hypothetical protein